MSLTELALHNLSAPMVLFFALGFLASWARSDLSVPEQLSKSLSLYLMLAIGFKGGVSLNEAGLTSASLKAVALGIGLSFLVPFVGFRMLQATTKLSRVDAAAIAAHYGSISVVTFVAASAFLSSAGVAYSGFMIAVVAAMETPAIMSGLWIARRGASARGGGAINRAVFREIFLNGSVVLLLGSFAVGYISGHEGDASVAAFLRAPFKGVLCLFLLDMGITAARRLQSAKGLSPAVFLFGIYMPIIGGATGVLLASMLGLSMGDAMLLGVLGGSASYIAVPAALRLALPEANPAISLSSSLGLTFPFNLVIGIPLYFSLAQMLAGPA